MSVTYEKNIDDKLSYKNLSGVLNGKAWRYGDKNNGNLGGTLSTLDGVEGYTDVEDGILSRDGWFGNVLTETDSNGNLFSYSYDKINRPVQYKNPQQGTINISYGYGLNNNYVQTTDENGNVMKYSYYSDGQIKEEKDITANKVIKSYAYSYTEDPDYAISTVTNHSDYGNTTTLTTYFDSLGRVEINELKNSAGTVIYREEYLYEQAVNNLYDCVTKTVKGETDAEDYITKQYTDKFGNVVKEEVLYNNNGTQESIVTE